MVRVTIDDIRREERARAYQEIADAIQQLIAIYQAGVPALAGHPINDEARVAVPLLQDLRAAIEREAKKKP